MADLLNGIASVIGDLLVTVQTTVDATKTVATTSTPQSVVVSTPTSSSADNASPTSSSIEQTATSPNSTPTSTSTTTPTSTSTLTTTFVVKTSVSSSELRTSITSTPSITSQSLPTTSTSSTSIATLSGVEKPLTSSGSLDSAVILTSSTSSSPRVTPAASSVSDAAAPSQVDRKPAIIGGVIGAISGVVLISLIVFFCCLRRRRRQHRRHDSQITEQFHYQPRPEPYRLPTGMSELNFDHAAPLVRPTVRSEKSFKSVNGNLIHMSLDRFTRPFYEQEGYRDNVEPGLLRCTNPDRSLPVTPNLASKRISDPFNRVKLPYQSTISEKEIGYSDSSGLRQPPLVHIEEASPDEYEAPPYRASHGAPSFRSYPSIHTPSPRTSRWSLEPPVPSLGDKSRPARPTPSPLHGVASRTLSSIGSALRLSSAKTDKETHLRPEPMANDASRYQSQRVSAASDPFDLDSPTRRSAMPTGQRLSFGSPKNFMTYEGT